MLGFPPPGAVKTNSSTIDRTTVVVANPRHASCELEGEAVILALDSGIYYGLDGVGKLVWELIQEPRAIEAVCTSVQEVYDVGHERCLNDVIRLVDHLREAGLVEIHTA